jgi:hypothetical protein
VGLAGAGWAGGGYPVKRECCAGLFVQQGWQMLLQEYKGQEVLRRVVQVRGLASGFQMSRFGVWGSGSGELV